MFSNYSKGQVLFDMWLTQILTEEKFFRPELLSSTAFKKFLLKLDPRITVGPPSRYQHDNLSLMYERMKKDVYDLLQTDMSDQGTITYVPSLWLNSKTLSTYLVSSISYTDKLFQTKTVLVKMQKLAESRLEYLAVMMDNHLEMIPGLDLDSTGKITYNPKSEGLSRACRLIKHSRVVFEGIPTVIQRFWNATVGKFDNIKRMFEKVEKILTRMKTEPLCATKIFKKATDAKLKIPAWSQKSREEQLNVVHKLRSVLTVTNRPPKFPVEDAFTDEEATLFKELYPVMADIDNLLDFLKTQKTLANVPIALYNFTEFCTKMKSEKENDDVKRFLQALVDDLQVEAGAGFNFNNEVIKLSSILHPFFKGD